MICLRIRNDIGWPNDPAGVFLQSAWEGIGYLGIIGDVVSAIGNTVGAVHSIEPLVKGNDVTCWDVTEVSNEAGQAYRFAGLRLEEA